MIAGNGTVALARVALFVGVLLSPLAWPGSVQAGWASGAGPQGASWIVATFADKDALVPPTTIGTVSPPAAPDPSFAPPPEPSPPPAVPPSPAPPLAAPPAPAGSPEVASSLEFPAPAPDPGPRRPRFSMSMGMGISGDSSGLVDQRTVLIPSFEAQVGVGEGFLGLELRLFSNQAAGRYHQKASAASTPAGTAPAADTAVDRLALDLMLALRPLTYRLREMPGWLPRVARSIALNVGFAAESDSVGPPSVHRYGPVVGGHVDFPLTRLQDATDLRVRLSGRRMYAGEAHAGAVNVADTKVEFFGGLALIF